MFKNQTLNPTTHNRPGCGHAAAAHEDHVRQQQLADIAKRAYAIGSSMAGDPANVALVPHVEETRRLKKLARRKKPAPKQNPKPAPSPNTPGQPHLAEAPDPKA